MSMARVRRLVWPALLVLVAVAGASGAWAEPRVIALALRDGRLPDGQRVIRVQQGDEVTLTWTSDRPFTLHLHGYDIEETIAPGKPLAMRFTARATGRFPIETHDSRGQERTVGYLEVHPR